MMIQDETVVNQDILKYIKDDRTEFSQAEEPLMRLLRRQSLERPIIFIGLGTCGRIAGAEKTKKQIEHYLENRHLQAEIIETGCIGLCSAEPVVDIQLPGKTRISYQNVTEEIVTSILDDAFNNQVNEDYVLGQYRDTMSLTWDNVPFLDELPFFALQTKLVLQNCGIIDPNDINEYIARGGYNAYRKTIRHYKPEDILKLVKDSGLRGRGGGGFPTGLKWETAFNTESDLKYLICNADESDPGAYMDRLVIEGDPHKLIEGMAIAAFAIGASEAIIYIRSEYPLATAQIQKAIHDAERYDLLGKNILNTGFDLAISVHPGAGAFVCGEETALIESIEGKRGLPRPKPPFPAVHGLFGKPTVVNNVETLVNIPSIVEQGPTWFKNIGTEHSKGTKVFVITGKSKITGCVEVPMGTTLRQIIYDIADGIRDDKDLKAVQMGGASGACIHADYIDIEIDYESLQQAGAMMGSGGLVVMDEDTCMVDVAKFFLDFLRKESCGKCIPCREGTQRMYEILDSITRKPVDGKEHESLSRFRGMMMLEELAKVISETSLCGFGQTAPNPVLSTLRYFRDEYEEHIYDRKCRAGVCRKLREFMITVENCIGCTVCARKCPANAIIGTPRMPHFIINDKCIGCGTCYDVCKFNAIAIS